MGLYRGSLFQILPGGLGSLRTPSSESCLVELPPAEPQEPGFGTAHDLILHHLGDNIGAI